MSAFEKPGRTGRDSKDFMAIAGMITSEGLPGDFAQKRKKHRGIGREQGGGGGSATARGPGGNHAHGVPC